MFGSDEVMAVVDIAGHGYNEFNGVFQGDTSKIEIDAHNYQVL